MKPLFFWISGVFTVLSLLGTVRGDDHSNIVFINADDLTHTDLSVYGGQVHTPNFERIA